VRGIYTEGNFAVVPIFRKWLEPFASMGVTKVSAQPTGGTDHEFMQTVGVPAFQFIQDPLDYASRIHHSSLDSYDHLKIADLKQAAVVLASMLWMCAEREQPLPRMPVQRKPAETNPFNYDDEEE
jgi:carboxypeptidase Q